MRYILDKMLGQYHAEVSTRPPRVPYRETITARAEGHHRHKKQTGGAGQFGEVFLRVEPMQDIRVIVYDGKHHPVDSKEVAFIAAGKRAFMDAIDKARPIILEPIVNIEITAPEASMGDIAGDV